MAQHWTLDSIPWSSFDASKVKPEHLVLAKTASVVEYNSADYVTYLKNVFHDDPEMQRAAEKWGEEEKQHGMALAMWAKLVDPAFDFENALARFRSSFSVALNTTESIRGSRSGELVARCMVEAGTTTYYSCLHDASEEPVFRAICKNIAVDEVHHFSLFYKSLQRYLKTEPLSLFGRIKVAIQRSAEVEDEELLFAYASANLNRPVSTEEMPTYLRGYMGLTYEIYSKKNLRKAMAMATKVVGLESLKKLPDLLTAVGFSLIQRKRRQFLALKPAASKPLSVEPAKGMIPA